MKIKKEISRAEVAQALHESYGLQEIGNQVLDIGFGDGEIVAQFLEFGYVVTALENQPTKIALLPHRLKEANISTDNLSIIKTNVLDFQFESSFYSAVVCQNVIHFIDKQRA